MEKIRTAAYIRVSTDSKDQENSFELQKKYFSELLRNNPQWENAGIYCDFGVSGTQSQTRTGFTNLIESCEQGRVDNIVCKSISRFSRNTLQCLETLRYLKNIGVNVSFEKENLSTGDQTGEFILTALTAIAQEESRSISENVRWSYEKRYPKGEVPNKAIYGYRFTGKKQTLKSGYTIREIEIVEEEAEVIRRIFLLFLQGLGPTEISRKLNAKSGDRWTPARVRAVLSQERYCGDVLTRKTVTDSFITHKQRKNTDGTGQYLIQNHHPAIISRQTFEQTKNLRAQQKRGGKMTATAAAPNITIIPAKHPDNIIRLRTGTLRVAAYCRVSTGDESQQTSYATQKRYYTEYIDGHKGWSLAGIYADEAASGTSRVHRTEFNRMIEDAMSGRIDYIVTKSISRFARNTVDTLKCVRELKELTPPVGCYFEKENIDTLDSKGELILTILSALAQDESRSISDNIRWAIRKKFENGEPIVNLDRMLGYDMTEDGTWVINEEQAETVRFIFERSLRGVSAGQIARELNDKGIKTVLGNNWRADSVLTILENEKYAGDVTMQKTVTRDYLTHKSVKNDGLAPQVHVRNHHEAIIPREQFETVQKQLELIHGDKKKEKKPRSPLYKMTYTDNDSKVHPMSRTTYTANAKGYSDERSLQGPGRYFFNYPVWKTSDGFRFENCERTFLFELAIEQSFMEAMYKMKREVKEKPKKINGNNKEEEGAFSLFLTLLYSLPDTNSAAFPLIINGLDDTTPGILDRAPDLLTFNPALYSACVCSATVSGDTITYETTFGTTFTTTGNSRTLSDFLGFRRSTPNKTLELLTSDWQINNRTVSFSKTTDLVSYI